MDGPRAPRDTEWPHILKFLDQNLRPSQNWSIGEEYPLVLNPHNLANIRVVVDGLNILSHAVLKYLLVKTPIGFFKVAAIGSVVTRSSHRGQGLSRAVLESCLLTAVQAGCDFAILWTDLFDFYRKLGFELAGLEISLALEKPLKLMEGPKFRFLESAKISPESINRIYSQHTVGSIRTVEDIRKNLTIPGSRVFTAWDEHNQLQAYAVEGKGVDLKGYVHEWGGGVSALLPLFQYVQKSFGGQITVLAPAHAQNLIRTLQEHSPFVHKGYLGMMKVLHKDNLIAKILRFARSRGFEDFVFEQHPDGLRLGTKSKTVLLPSERDWTRVLFGPFQACDLVGIDTPTAEILDQIFPIPMWIWGWDSV